MTPLEIDTPEWSRQQIEVAADFAFMGEPRAYMEFDFGAPGLRHIVYTVYGYAGGPPHLLVRGLTKDICDAITALDGRHCVIWRRYPELGEKPDVDEEGNVVVSDEPIKYLFTMRMAVVNEDWREVSLDTAVVLEGTSPQVRGHIDAPEK